MKRCMFECLLADIGTDLTWAFRRTEDSYNKDRHNLENSAYLKAPNTCLTDRRFSLDVHRRGSGWAQGLVGSGRVQRSGSLM